MRGVGEGQGPGVGDSMRSGGTRRKPRRCHRRSVRRALRPPRPLVVLSLSIGVGESDYASYIAQRPDQRDVQVAVRSVASYRASRCQRNRTTTSRSERRNRTARRRRTPSAKSACSAGGPTAKAPTMAAPPIRQHQRIRIADCRDSSAQGMTDQHPNNPMHGVTLEMVLERLVDRFGWKALGERIPIRCFTRDPSIKSSLSFLRRTPWARARVEALYLENGTRPGDGAR